KIPEAIEVIVDEAREPPSPVAAARPVVHGEHRLYADCLDGFAGLDITGIVFRREKRRHIEVIELFERHRKELEAIGFREFRQEFVWLAGAMQQCRDLSGLHFLKCDGIVDIERLHLHPETLEKDWARSDVPAPCVLKLTFLPSRSWKE